MVFGQVVVRWSSHALSRTRTGSASGMLRSPTWRDPSVMSILAQNLDIQIINAAAGEASASSPWQQDWRREPRDRVTRRGFRCVTSWWRCAAVPTRTERETAFRSRQLSTASGRIW